MELHIHGVSKTYASGAQALKDVTLTIPAGMYGLLGPNGAGARTSRSGIDQSLQHRNDDALRSSQSGQQASRRRSALPWTQIGHKL